MDQPNSVGLAFLGVTTDQSSVHKVFARWSECLERPLALEGHNLAVGASPDAYRRFVTYLREEHPRIGGSLITAHKAAVFDAASDLFDEITPVARKLGEVGMVYWRNGRLVGDANDAVSTTHILPRLLGTEQWLSGTRLALILGGGGAGVAVANTLSSIIELGCAGVVIAESDANRCNDLRARVGAWNTDVPISIRHVTSPSDQLVTEVGVGGLVANATGLGKDRAGSPVTPTCEFPANGTVWEFNYRFLPQDQPTFWQTARRQAESKGLILEDGWDYFIWGWLVVMSNILALPPEAYYQCFAAVAGTTERGRT